MAHDPASLGARALRDLIASGALSAEAATAACLKRIAETEPQLRAWAFVDGQDAVAQARALDARRKAGAAIGPLHGVPVGIKDVIDTAGMPTERGTPVEKGRVPPEDAHLVARLRAAGAVVIGKTATTELAYLAPSQARNPHDPQRTPGGSSSGSAVAVASGQVPLAVGTQTGGSVIRPASYCGTVGFKPSFGLIDRTGIDLAVLLFLGGQDIGSTAVAGQQIGAVIGRQQGREGVDALGDLQDIIAVGRNDGIEQIVAGASVAQ